MTRVFDFPGTHLSTPGDRLKCFNIVLGPDANHSGTDRKLEDENELFKSAVRSFRARINSPPVQPFHLEGNNSIIV